MAILRKKLLALIVKVKTLLFGTKIEAKFKNVRNSVGRPYRSFGNQDNLHTGY